MLRMMSSVVAFMVMISIVMEAQSVPKDTYYTLETAEAKVRKKYPSISRVKSDTLSMIEARAAVVYSEFEGRRLSMDIFRSSRFKGTMPAVLLIHGGGWRSGDRSMEVTMARYLASHGFVTAAVEYRLSPEAKYPAAVVDLKNAVLWIRDHAEEFGIDKNRIGLYGCSAGGHLASLIGMNDDPDAPEIQAVVNVDGPLDLTDPEESGKDADPTKPSACALWFGRTYSEAPEIWKNASPVMHVSQRSAPTAFINSAQERYHVGRERTIEQLKRYGIHSEVHTLPDSPHSFWLFHPWFGQTLEWTKDFFQRTLKNN